MQFCGWAEATVAVTAVPRRSTKKLFTVYYYLSRRNAEEHCNAAPVNRTSGQHISISDINQYQELRVIPLVVYQKLSTARRFRALVPRLLVQGLGLISFVL